jgi:hypothetical protein
MNTFLKTYIISSLCISSLCAFQPWDNCDFLEHFSNPERSPTADSPQPPVAFDKLQPWNNRDILADFRESAKSPDCTAELAYQSSPASPLSETELSSATMCVNSSDFLDVTDRMKCPSSAGDAVHTNEAISSSCVGEPNNAILAIAELCKGMAQSTKTLLTQPLTLEQFDALQDAILKTFEASALELYHLNSSDARDFLRLAFLMIMEDQLKAIGSICTLHSLPPHVYLYYLDKLMKTFNACFYLWDPLFKCHSEALSFQAKLLDCASIFMVKLF